jgi:hypothetical protein
MSNPVDLRELAGDRFKIALDESATAEPARSERIWLYRIPCRYGFIGVHGERTLVANCDRPRLFPALLAIPRATVRQRGDDEIAVIIEPDHLDDAAGILKAYRRRRLSADARERATARLVANRFSSHSRAPGAAPCDDRGVA